MQVRGRLVAAAVVPARLVDEHVSTLLVDASAHIPVPRRTLIPVTPV